MGLSVSEARNIIQVGKEVSYGDLKKAYKKKARECHPDSPNGSQEAFHLIKEAFEVLKKDLVESKNNSEGSVKSKIITFEQLEKLVNGGKVKLSDGEEISRDALLRHRMFIEVNFEIEYNGEVEEMSGICKFESFKMHRISGRLQVNEDTPKIKVRAFGKEAETKIENDYVAIILWKLPIFKVEFNIEKELRG